MNELPCYFAIFGLPSPIPEHVQIVDVIRTASAGDFKQFVMTGGMGFVFSSSMKPWQLSFDRILLNADTLFITEINEGFTHRGYGAAAGWLNSHFPKR